MLINFLCQFAIYEIIMSVKYTLQKAKLNKIPDKPKDWKNQLIILFFVTVIVCPIFED